MAGLEILVLLLFGCSLSSGSQFPPRQYHYVNFTTNWSDAQRYCREHYTDLATFESMDDVNMLKSNFSSDTWAWIGLEDPPESWKWNMGNDTNSWRWSVTGETNKTGYESWAQTEPNNEYGHENCVFTSPSGQWLDASCEITKGFVCFNVTEQNQKIYQVYPHLTNWTSARDYCREHHTDLAMIENGDENAEVSSLITDSSGSWIGLFREPWRWTDGSQSSFRNWRENSPNNAGGEQFCIVEDTQRHVWDDDGCDKQYIFICHQVTKLKHTVKMTLKTDVDLTDPNMNGQLLRQLSLVLSDQGWTNFTLRWNIQPQKLKKED
ncbi:macrophage mannose receptor 1-like isoform X1 [Echeneis naucrates]|uniref:macrophage mannose receptor 1-like isoform X1 n=1 Tax=Echeneis naucrates TaxID=173247 RepID=UPI001113B2B7|nr:macrophage mannose receptor 1-like isoform X1 [Echeneis naucrates]